MPSLRRLCTHGSKRVNSLPHDPSSSSKENGKTVVNITRKNGKTIVNITRKKNGKTVVNITTLLQGDPNISNNMNSLIFKAVQDFITQSGRFAME